MQTNGNESGCKYRNSDLNQALFLCLKYIQISKLKLCLNIIDYA